MPNIIIDDSQTPMLKYMCQSELGKERERLDRLKTETKETQKKVDGWLSMLRQLEAQEQVNDHIVDEQFKGSVTNFEDGYSSNMNWANKIAHIIKKHGWLSTGDIVDKLIRDYEPALNRKLTVKSVSSTLSQNVGNKFKKNISPLNNVNVYDINELDGLFGNDIDDGSNEPHIINDKNDEI